MADKIFDWVPGSYHLYFMREVRDMDNHSRELRKWQLEYGAIIKKNDFSTTDSHMFCFYSRSETEKK